MTELVPAIYFYISAGSNVTHKPGYSHLSRHAFYWISEIFVVDEETSASVFSL